MIGDERGLVVLDWDGATMAPSALDAADFLARLRQEPLRSPGTAEPMSRLAEVFRREFLSREPLVAAQDLAAHEALALIEKALRSLRRPGEARSMTDEIRHQLAAAAELLS
jgi:thiamine kinase-like enzyme